MKTSDAINEICAALAKAQGEIANPAKEAENPHFRSHYADLSAGINAVREGLSKNGIAYVQSTRLDGDVLMLDTRLSHSSGQWLESEFPACRFPAKPQEVGSALTYARRYSLFSMVGIAGEDDDGNEASKSVTPAPKRTPTPPKPPAPPADDSHVVRDMLIEALLLATTTEDLSDWYSKNAKPIAELGEEDKRAVRDEYAAKMTELKGRQAA